MGIYSSFAVNLLIKHVSKSIFGYVYVSVIGLIDSCISQLIRNSYQ